MGSRKNERNQAIRRRVYQDCSKALELWTEGRRVDARRLLEMARDGLHCAPWNGGQVWQDASIFYETVALKFEGPCDCLCCELTDEQREKLREDVREKTVDLSSAYDNEENNYTGAFAEAIFAQRFGFQLNKVRGFDGGNDFKITSEKTLSKTLTIDVKGTTFGRLVNGRVKGNFPFQKTWNAREDHIYVLLQIVELEHAYFRGFAFGDDKLYSQLFCVGEEKHFLEAIAPERSLAELEDLLGIETPHINSINLGLTDGTI